MSNFNTGEVVLMLFPFSGLSGARRRPALVLIDTGDEDIVVARITSQTVRDTFDVELMEWREAGLLLPSVVRLHKLATLEKSLVERRLGSLMPGDWAMVSESLRKMWSELQLEI